MTAVGPQEAHLSAQLRAASTCTIPATMPGCQEIIVPPPLPAVAVKCAPTLPFWLPKRGSSENAPSAGAVAQAEHALRCQARANKLTRTLLGSLSGVQRGEERLHVQGAVACLVGETASAAVAVFQWGADGWLTQVTVKNMATAKAILAFGHVRDYFKLVPRSKVARRLAQAAELAAAAQLGANERLAAGAAAGAPGADASAPTIAGEVTGFDADLGFLMTCIYRNLACENTTEAKAAQFAKEVRPRCMLLDDKDFSTPDRVFGTALGNAVVERLRALAEAESARAAHALRHLGAEAALVARGKCVALGLSNPSLPAICPAPAV